MAALDRSGRFSDGRLAARGPLEITGSSPFARLATAHALGLAGDVFLTVALSGSLFFNVRPGEARPKLVAYLLLTMAPFAVVAPVLGPALDRIQGGRRLLLALSCLGRAVAVWLMARHLHGLLLYPLAFVVLVLAKTHAVAKAALVPAVVEADGELVDANSRLALIGVVVGVIAAFPAVAILKVLDAAWVLRAGAVVYLAGFVFGLRLPKPAPIDPEVAAEAKAQVRAGSVRLASTAMAVLRGGVGYVTFLLAFELKRPRHPSALQFGLVLAASAIGGLVGNVIAPRLRRRMRVDIILTVSLLIPAIAALFTARRSGTMPFAIVAATVGAGGAAGKIAFDSLVQRDAPSATQGRAFAMFETRFQLAWVAGALLPVVIAPLRIRLGLLILALVLGFFGLSHLGGQRRLSRSKTVPDPPAADERPADPHATER